jgi:hypothetical protein
MQGNAKQLDVNETKKTVVRNLFPKIALIKDDHLRKQVIDVWVEAWNLSKLQSLEDIPINRDKVFTFVKHTNVTAMLALMMAEILKTEYEMTINMDYLLAIAFLHDADQIILREKIAGKVEHTRLERLIPHGTYCAHIALAKGLPPEIAHGIMFHRPGTEPVTVEALIVKYCDSANYYAYALAMAPNP